MERESAILTEKGNDGHEEIMEVADGIPGLPSYTEFEPEIKITVEESKKMVKESAVEEKEKMLRQWRWLMV